MSFKCEVQHHIPTALLLWRAVAVALQSGTHTAVAFSARRVAGGKGALITTLNRRANKRCIQQELPLSRPTHGRLPLPYPQERHGMAPAYGGGVSSRHAMSHWSALRSRLFPALRLAALPVAAACLATFAGVKGHPEQPRFVGLHSSRLPAREPFASTRAEIFDPVAPADVSTARQLLESRGFMHPGMQPGVTWGAIPASRCGPSPHPTTETHLPIEHLYAQSLRQQQLFP
ncbi:hypothetical protein Vretimale_2102 [Volvox reticuliferus]|uniref:Uncharacterized protein n=1 Tax=Volvox reticuliferus TaxID=1737510 RepID=A0A8J4D6T5_9CHLO|nr:hypothetical protein Vretifemale_4314 [Volvox reticuliferus]GIL96241.1 hypothetical protein Vretimale_2102 [Volvox reticuliferus]